MDLIGQTIGNYQIEALLGSGGMGQVFRAQHVQLQRAAAFKVLHPQYAADETFRGRFVQEARTAAALVHPNIIEIYDFGQQDDWYYLVMELVEDGSLRSLLRSPDGLPLWLGLDLVRQAADGLAYAHQRAMVHRDIKPDNLLLTRALVLGALGDPYVVKISDFGLAKLAEGGMQTIQGQTMGTPAYMSPEQCQALPLDGRSDIYSLGIVLYEVATGVVPFQTTGLSDAVYHHVYVEPPPPRKARPDLSPELEAIILRCLKKAPHERYPDAAELSRALQEVVRALRSNPAVVTTISPSPVISIPASIPAQVSVTFEHARQTIVPGEESAVRLVLASPPGGPRELDVQLDDVPADWLPASSATVSLPPGTRQTVSLPVTVPRSAEVAAGDYPITLRATAPGADPITVQAVWVVAPYLELRLDVTPERTSGWSRGRFRVGVTSLGNTAAAVVLGARSIDAALTLDVQPAMVELKPGETHTAHLSARGPFSWTGTRTRAINVEARGPSGTHETRTLAFTQRSLLPVLAPVAALLLIAAVVAGFVLRGGNGEPTDGLTPTPLAASTASAAVVVVVSPTATAMPSPTATLIPEVTPVVAAPPIIDLGTLPYFVFSSGRGKPPGVLEVYRMSADGSHLTALTQNDQDDWEPAISYDTTQVAFVSTRDGHNQIYVMNADGSGQLRLTNDPASDENPRWSPSGPYILFSRRIDERIHIMLINADGSGLTELAEAPGASNWSPSWSPDGNEIAFVSDRFGRPNIYVIGADGSNLRRLTTSISDDTPRWSYDGSRILFVSHRDGNGEIYVMNRDGSNQTRLTNTPVDESDPAWSPDDGQIAFASGGDVLIMQADGLQRTALTHDAGYDSWLDWSPAGGFLAFASNRDGNREVYVVQADGSGLRRLTDNPGFDGNPAWAPSLP